MKHVESSRGAVSVTTDSSIKIKWDSVSDYEGLPVTSYKVYIDDGAGNFNPPIIHTNINFLEYEFINLNDQGEYQFYVEAGNDIGYGQPSDIVTYIAANIPGACDHPNFETATNTSITMSWNPPSDNGGLMIQGYKVYMNDFSNDEFNLVYDGSSKASIVTFTINGLTAGKYY